ncbi:trypsin-like peptidase domain-containing protein [Streptomyces sp. NPDC002838]|uniref:effector-associated domain 2-containing protein n=1 Tax=Streptomyces sp. NPDC002838 TaxID=3154436 RepID=UPI003324391C
MRGAGILVMPGVVLTCAHVVASAAGAAGNQAVALPERAVLVDVPGRPDIEAGEASVVPDGWFPGPLAGGSGGDLAVLRTAWSPPHDVVPAPLGSCGEPDRREVSVYGHPAGAPDGLVSTARLVGRGGPHRDWVQMEGLGTVGAWVGHGFSGAGVWDPAGLRVVGMVTAAYTDRQAKVAWMLPLEAAAQMWPTLYPMLEHPAVPTPTGPERTGPPTGATLRPAEPHGPPIPRQPAGPPSDRDQFALAEALLNVAQVEDDGAAALRRLLPAPIRRAIRTHPRPRLQLFYVVQACADHRDGRQALLDALRLLDDESEPARAALGLIAKLWPTGPEGETS